MKHVFFKDFRAGIAVVNWDDLNVIHDAQDDCLKYLGNHLGDDSELYAVFAGEGVFTAVKIQRPDSMGKKTDG